MNQERLQQLLQRMARQRLLVIGDYFLDLYLDIDRCLAETSLETGLEAHQIMAQRASPGAAGNVAANVRALGARVSALGPIGDDGDGYELRRALGSLDIDTSSLISAQELVTPTYIKPMLREADGRVHELNRMDIKNRRPLPLPVQQQLIAHLRELAGVVDGIIVNDQVPGNNHGAITAKVRAALLTLGRDRPDMPITVDSRERIGLFRHLTLKPNARELGSALGLPCTQDLAQLEQGVRTLTMRTERPVFCTLGKEGCLVSWLGGTERVPAVPVRGEIDIVGAGDTALAAITTALCAGATPAEAALLGNLAAAVTVQCIGTTGTASPAAILQSYQAWRSAKDG